MLIVCDTGVNACAGEASIKMLSMPKAAIRTTCDFMNEVKPADGSAGEPGCFRMILVDFYLKLDF